MVNQLQNLFVKKNVDNFLRKVKGTTTIGLKGKNFVLLVADKRATAENLIIHKNANKIVKVTDKSAATIAGLVADAQVLTRYIKSVSKIYGLEKNEEIKIRILATLLGNILFNARPNIFLTQFLVGGVDEEGPHLYNVEFFGSITSEDYTVTGSGSPIAIGVLESRYSKDLTIEEAEKLAVSALSSAISRDSATGDGIDVAVITNKGVHLLTQEEKKKILDNI